jgi:chromosomal replication initiator protein
MLRDDHTASRNIVVKVSGGFMDQAYLGQWERVCARLRAEFGDAAFNSWLKPLQFEGIDGPHARLSAPTRFMRDWVVSHYGERIRNIWNRESEDVLDIRIQVRPRPAAPEAAGKRDTDIASAELPMSAAEAVAAPGATGTDMGSALDPRFQFDSFVVGKSNELAYAAAHRVADSPSVTFNPLFLYGGVGLGKTHLMHAIAWHIQQRDPGRKVLYLSAEKFMYQFIRALRDRDAMTFKQVFRSVDVLLIDDVQFFSRKDSTQEEFFHTFNALVDQNKQIVISADRSPSDLEDVEERIRSRLGWGLVADIHQTDFELRFGILEQKLNQSGVQDFPRNVLEFLAHRITSNVRELEGALNRLVAYSHLVGRPVTLELTQDVLQDLLRSNDRRVTIEEIQKKVAQHFNIRLADMHSARRARNVARPRQVAMYLAKQLTTRSLPEIGRKFGGRDHTTVMHAVRRIEELRQTDASLAEDIDLLRRMLEA